MKIISQEATWFDYLLSAVSAILAAYTAGMGISQPKIGLFFTIGILIGSLLSYGLGRLLRDKPAIKLDGLLYALFAIGAIAFVKPLNSLLPEGGFAPQLMVGGLLSWMLMLGSFATWRDFSLLFQAVPSIALFGLGGVWDTFKGATILFFGFLLCTATLFARAHARGMLGQAMDSGSFGRGLRSNNPEQTDRAEANAAKSLAAGPWRWMAGPEWALASAAAIVLISLIGAPLFQQSLQAVAGSVKISLPAPSAALNLARNFSSGRNSLTIGEGPRRLRGAEVLKLKIDHPRYMRGTTFDTYTGAGWERRFSRYFAKGDESVAYVAQRSSNRPYDPRDLYPEYEEIPFELTVVEGSHDKFYVPGEAFRLPLAKSCRVLLDGTISPASLLDEGKTYRASVLVPGSQSDPVEAGNPLGHMANWIPTTRGKTPFIDPGPITNRVRELALSVTKDATTDFEKAQAIKAAIEQRVKYNLDAPATPEGKDPVDTFLFDSKEGYCDLFASSMALMARAAGLPSRVVIGFIVTDGKRDDEGRFSIKDSDYHAWAEIFFKDHGWVAFDPTEGAPNVGGLPKDSTPWFQQPWAKIGVEIVLVACAIIGLGLVLRSAFGQRTALSQNPRNEYGRLYRGFEKEVERRVGFARRLSQTPAEYMMKSYPLLGAAAEQAKEMSQEFEAVFYSKASEDSSELTKIAAGLKTIRSIPMEKKASKQVSSQ